MLQSVRNVCTDIHIYIIAIIYDIYIYIYIYICDVGVLLLFLLTRARATHEEELIYSLLIRFAMLLFVRCICPLYDLIMFGGLGQGLLCLCGMCLLLHLCYFFMHQLLLSL